MGVKRVDTEDEEEEEEKGERGIYMGREEGPIK